VPDHSAGAAQEDAGAVTRETWKLLIALAAIAFAVGSMLSKRPVERPPGVLAPHDPRQQSVDAPTPLELHGYVLEPRARFEVEARVLSAERYRWDAGASLAPLDLALGWGPMSDSSVLSRFRVTQGARYYTLYPKEGAPELDEALRHSANMHLIPADAAVARVLDSARKGHVVTLRGRLVDAARPDGFTWRTSLSRDDTGAGACELFLVEAASLR
jgi:hypothetical protein